MSDNMELWNKVSKTDPRHTKSANVRGNKITAIAPQTQIKSATEQWGPYGTGWGFKDINFCYDLFEKTGIVLFVGQFYYPGGAFPISASISAYRDGAQTKPDADFAKKVETDALTKALSKVGFNADVFMGLYDDHKYVQLMQAEFAEPLIDLGAWLASFNLCTEQSKQSQWDGLSDPQRDFYNKQAGV